MEKRSIPSVSVTYARSGASTKVNALGMRLMQERAYEKRGEQYLLIKSPPASGKSRALMFIALDKLHNQGIKQAIIVVPEKSIGASFNDEPLSKTTAARSSRWARSSKAMTRCWCAPTRPSALLWMPMAWGHLTTG
jgi:hypothetical protein